MRINSIWCRIPSLRTHVDLLWAPYYLIGVPHDMEWESYSLVIRHILQNAGFTRCRTRPTPSCHGSHMSSRSGCWVTFVSQDSFTNTIFTYLFISFCRMPILDILWQATRTTNRLRIANRPYLKVCFEESLTKGSSRLEIRIFVSYLCYWRMSLARSCFS